MAESKWACAECGESRGGSYRRYRTLCVTCGRAAYVVWQRKWRAANRERVRELDRRAKARRNPEVVRVQKRAAFQRWYAEHAPEVRERQRQWRARHPDLARERWNRWEEQHSDRVVASRNASNWMRRARLAEVQSAEVSSVGLVARFAFYGHRCWLCRTEATQVDHVKPVSKGGAHMLCNLRPICGPCNSRKGAQWPFVREVKK